jgi:hypothetical protein
MQFSIHRQPHSFPEGSLQWLALSAWRHIGCFVSKNCIQRTEVFFIINQFEFLLNALFELGSVDVHGRNMLS